MLTSTKIQRRQSEIRQDLAKLVANDTPNETETRALETMDREYQTNETRLRAALLAEAAERREAGEELETRDKAEWRDLIGAFEVRQIALALDEGKGLTGQTAEAVAELRAKGGFQGLPLPLEVLEQRAGETVASGTPNPVDTRPIIDRLFPQSVAARMGLQMINIGVGEVEWPVVTSSITAGWAATETGDVSGPTVYAVTDRPLKPLHNLGIQVEVTRRALKQSGAALEAAIRRDLAGAIGSELDKAAFLGTGANGQPLGLIHGASTYGIGATAVNAAASWAAFRAAITQFMIDNAAGSPTEVRVMIRPEVWSYLDSLQVGDGGFKFEFDRLVDHVTRPHVIMTANALAAPAGDPLATQAFLTTSAGGVAPGYVGMWGAVDMIRDPYSKAASGALKITALTTADVTVTRPAQSRVLTGVRPQADAG
jgi:HK97 family phage major capsid protein